MRRLDGALEMIDVSADLLKQRAAVAVAAREELFLVKGEFFFPLCLSLFSVSFFKRSNLLFR